jgi:hypothetical protein
MLVILLMQHHSRCKSGHLVTNQCVDKSLVGLLYQGLTTIVVSSPDVTCVAAAASDKGLPGGNKQFSAPNFTEQYDIEAKVQSQRPL